MALFTDKIILMDRTNPTAWSAGDPIGTTDLPDGTDITMTQDGDMRPWRVRLELVNSGITGEVNYGSLKLRMDENLTFVNTGPLLMNEDAKKKYLIEAYIIQTDDDGSNIESKRFRFQLGTPSLDYDKNLGSVLTITLQEIQYRMKEVPSSRELRFVSPKTALDGRIIDFNNHQINGVNIISTDNRLPDIDVLQLSYIPQSPKTIHNLIDGIFEDLSEPSIVGGVFTDFYYDFDPTSATLTTDMTADEIGRVDSGVVIDPLSTTPLDADEEQSANTDFVRFKNHVVIRGSADSGSLPIDHSVFSSNWERARLRPEWSVSNSVTDRGGTAYNYLKGHTVKVTYDTGIANVPKIIRFFKALQNVTTPPPHPATSPTNWEEDFITIPEFDVFGSYEENDVVYQFVSGEYRFYRAKEDIFAWTLNGWRSGKNSSNPPNSFLDASGFLNLPSFDSTHWENISSAHTGGGDIVTAHDSTSFVGFQTYSPWTVSVFDWEKNMVGLKSGSLIGVTGDRYVGLCPDWNMAKDVYDKQDATDQFETITMKWVSKVGVNSIQDSGTIGESQISDEERYHGNRVVMGNSPSSEFTTDYNEQFSSGDPDNKVAEWDKTGGTVGQGIWRFSAEPVEGDFVTNLDDGKIWYYDGASWEIGWEFEGFTDRRNPKASGAWAHPVKDVYKVNGFEGTPSNAIEFRYVWNIPLSDGITILEPQPEDDNATRVKKGRIASRGAWLWFWNPFPRLPEGVNGRDIGDLFGGHGETPSPASGFTTLNIYNSVSDKKQSTRGWNNGLNTEDMGKINGLSFKMKVGVFADSVDEHNDLKFKKLGFPIIGMENVPMIFWAIDDFDRIWFKRFALRKNNEWDSVTIEFGDLAQTNLYLPRWDELRNLLGIPLSAFNFELKQKEYTGVQFDWRFVRGWGTMLADGYDSTGFYNGGIDSKVDQAQDIVSQIEQGLTSAWIQAEDVYKGINTLIHDGIVEARKQKFHTVTTERIQATIAIDDIYYNKELIANSDDIAVENARTIIEYKNNETDYIGAKITAKGKRERLSFFPQFWHFRAIGNVKLRLGQRFKVKGDRVPENPKSYPLWNSVQAYAQGAKVKFTDSNGIQYAYQALETTGAGANPETSGLWENLNELSVSTIKHIIDGTGYHIELAGRRKFIFTGEA